MSVSARDYHSLTAYQRNRMSGHALDWGGQPDVFKTYPSVDPLPLPEAATWPDLRALALHSESVDPDLGTAIDINLLAAILGLSHAITAKATHGGVDFYYRSVASAGALYPFELYVGVSNVQGMANGCYHHSVARQALTQLRCEDITDYLARAVRIGDQPAPAVSFFLTTIFYRSSWKYRDRAYRYNLLDTGHLIENLTAALTLFRVPFNLYYDFDDAVVNDLLSLDTDREVCLAVAFSWGKPQTEDALKSPARAVEDPRSASRVSPREVDYPLIRQIHEATFRVVHSKASPGNMPANLTLKLDTRIEVPFPERSPEMIGYADAVFRRRSMRNFVRSELSSDCFKTLVNVVCCDADSHDRVLDDTLALGLLVEDVEGVEPGFYVLDRKRRSLLPAAYGSMMDVMASACLNQVWLNNCAMHFLFLGNLDLVERLWGARAYRYAMLSAGRLGQRIYVASTAMRLGCCGIGAFYDDEAGRVLGLTDACKLLYLMAVGPVRKWPVGSR